MSSAARTRLIRAAGVAILLLALAAALLPLVGMSAASHIIGGLLVAAGAVELGAALARSCHRPSASIAAAATIVAGLRLLLDPGAGFFVVLNLVILWLVVRAGALTLSASRSHRTLRGWIAAAAATDFLLAVLLLIGAPVAILVVGLFGPTGDVVATFAWVFAASFIATACLLIAAAPLEATERP